MAKIVKDISSVLDNFNVVVFDFDGTLVNSEPAHMHGHIVMLSTLLGHEIPNFISVFKSKYIGKRDSLLFDEFIKDFNVKADKDTMLKLKAEASLNKVLTDKDNMLTYIDELKKCKANKRYYILSNNNKHFIDKVLASKGYADMFDNIFAMENMGITKDYFMEHIGEYIKDVTLDNLIVFEDSITQVQYLVERGYHTVGVENMFNVDKLNSAEYIIKDGFKGD